MRVRVSVWVRRWWAPADWGCSGTVVQGTFRCRKSADNSRELDVEIHYTVQEPDAEAPPSEVVVQLFKVR